MSLYKRFRGHEPSPEALLKERDYYKSQYDFISEPRQQCFGFIKRKRPSAKKNRNAFDREV
jgi:hypothetical protein